MDTATLTRGKKSRWTDAEITRWPNDGFKRELIEGDIYMSPVGYTHSNVCVNILLALTKHVRRHDLGRVFDSSIGFRLGPKSLLSPDVSFVSHAHLAAIMVTPEKFLAGAPDLAIEVISPSDLRSIVSLKLDKVFGPRDASGVACRSSQVLRRNPHPGRVHTAHPPLGPHRGWRCGSGISLQAE